MHCHTTPTSTACQHKALLRHALDIWGCTCSMATCKRYLETFLATGLVSQWRDTRMAKKKARKVCAKADLIASQGSLQVHQPLISVFAHMPVAFLSDSTCCSDTGSREIPRSQASPPHLPSVTGHIELITYKEPELTARRRAVNKGRGLTSGGLGCGVWLAGTAAL